MKELKIGNKIARVPVIQGGMGVGISRSGLAGAVAAAGGVGIISTAQIGYDEDIFEKNQKEANVSAIEKHIKLAKKQADGGLVGVNVMVALKDYAEHVKASVAAGADVVISGAGLPINLPELVGDSGVKISPIISTEKAARVILRMWDKRYRRTADFLVIEGPKAGGHLGFSEKELLTGKFLHYGEEIRKIIAVAGEYGDKFGVHIPVVVAGGIFDKEDVTQAVELGADGVQVASRFVATEECDAPLAYKQAYVNATDEDVVIIKSPVGMPGRAIRNAFLDAVALGRQKISKCYGCLAKCNPAEIPYCITEALIRAVNGDIENGLIFAGANVGKIDRISTVAEIMEELQEGFAVLKK